MKDETIAISATGHETLSTLIDDAGAGVPIAGVDDGIRVNIEAVSGSSSGSGDPVVLIQEPVRRGRKPGSKNGTSKEPAKKKADLQKDVDALQKKLDALESRNNKDAVERLANMLELGAKVAFGWAVDFRGERWKQSPGNLKDFGESGALALAPYADKLSEDAPWFIFAMCVAGMISKPLSGEFEDWKARKTDAQKQMTASSVVK